MIWVFVNLPVLRKSVTHLLRFKHLPNSKVQAAESNSERVPVLHPEEILLIRHRFYTYNFISIYLKAYIYPLENSSIETPVESSCISICLRAYIERLEKCSIETPVESVFASIIVRGCEYCTTILKVIVVPRL